jgi:hypothetical protein
MRNTNKLSNEGTGSSHCCVANCHLAPLIAVAGNDSGNVMMCSHHAVAWTSSDHFLNRSEDGHHGIVLALAHWIDTGAAAQAA